MYLGTVLSTHSVMDRIRDYMILPKIYGIDENIDSFEEKHFMWWCYRRDLGENVFESKNESFEISEFFMRKNFVKKACHKLFFELSGLCNEKTNWKV